MHRSEGEVCRKVVVGGKEKIDEFAASVGDRIVRKAAARQRVLPDNPGVAAVASPDTPEVAVAVEAEVDVEAVVAQSLEADSPEVFLQESLLQLAVDSLAELSV